MSPRFPTAVNSCVAKGRFNPPQPPPLCLPRGHGRSDVESLRETSPCLQTLSLQEFWCQTQSAPPVFPPSFHRLLLLLFSCSVASDSLWSQGLWPTRLLCPWDFPGRNARVVAASFLGSPWPRDWTHVSRNGTQILCHGATREAPFPQMPMYKASSSWLSLPSGQSHTQTPQSHGIPGLPRSHG